MKREGWALYNYGHSIARLFWLSYVIMVPLSRLRKEKMCEADLSNLTLSRLEPPPNGKHQASRREAV